MGILNIIKLHLYIDQSSLSAKNLDSDYGPIRYNNWRLSRPPLPSDKHSFVLLNLPLSGTTRDGAAATNSRVCSCLVVAPWSPELNGLKMWFSWQTDFISWPSDNWSSQLWSLLAKKEQGLGHGGGIVVFAFYSVDMSLNHAGYWSSVLNNYEMTKIKWKRDRGKKIWL